MTNFFEQFENSIIIAHRGNSFSYPENTMLAFENCLYADIVEFDIQLSHDNKFVVFHDELLTRTTNFKDIFPNTKKNQLGQHSLKELKNLDISSWFDEKLATQNIVTLDEVVSFFKSKDIPLNIEIKKMKDKSTKMVAEYLFDSLNSLKYLDQCLFSSFEHEYLTELRKLSDEINIAPLFFKYIPKDISYYKKSLNPCAFHLDSSLASIYLINYLKQNNIYTNIYTVNDENKMKELFFMGAKGIFSDTNIKDM